MAVISSEAVRKGDGNKFIATDGDGGESGLTCASSTSRLRDFFQTRSCAWWVGTLILIAKLEWHC